MVKFPPVNRKNNNNNNNNNFLASSPRRLAPSSTPSSPWPPSSLPPLALKFPKFLPPLVGESIHGSYPLSRGGPRRRMGKPGEPIIHDLASAWNVPSRIGKCQAFHGLKGRETFHLAMGERVPSWLEMRSPLLASFIGSEDGGQGEAVAGFRVATRVFRGLVSIWCMDFMHESFAGDQNRFNHWSRMNN